MLIYPAIDLIEGRCVRLALGDFDAVTHYGEPKAQLADFARAGASWAHVVDLDGAKAGSPKQRDLIGTLVHAAGVRIQSGGGVRARADVVALLDAGVARVVIGSAAVKRPDDVRDWIDEFGVERVCCAFDLKADGDRFEVAVHGWRDGAGVSLDDALAYYPPGTLKHILVTDVSRDGVLSGPNVALMERLVRARPDLAVQASGGVASLGDLRQLRGAGVAGAIVGRALYEKKFMLEDALAS